MNNRIYLMPIVIMVGLLSASFANADVTVVKSEFIGSSKDAQKFVSATLKPSENSINLALGGGLKKKIEGIDDASIKIDVDAGSLNSISHNKFDPKINYSLSVNF